MENQEDTNHALKVANLKLDAKDSQASGWAGLLFGGWMMQPAPEKLKLGKYEGLFFFGGLITSAIGALAVASGFMKEHAAEAIEKTKPEKPRFSDNIQPKTLTEHAENRSHTIER